MHDGAIVELCKGERTGTQCGSNDVDGGFGYGHFALICGNGYGLGDRCAVGKEVDGHVNHSPSAGCVNSERNHATEFEVSAKIGAEDFAVKKGADQPIIGDLEPKVGFLQANNSLAVGPQREATAFTSKGDLVGSVAGEQQTAGRNFETGHRDQRTECKE